PGPTFACLATSSRLVAAPWRGEAVLATSRMRSRLRSASARGLRSVCFVGLVRFVVFVVIRKSTRRWPPLILASFGRGVWIVGAIRHPIDARHSEVRFRDVCCGWGYQGV